MISFLPPMMVSWHWTRGCLMTLLPVVCASHWATLSIFAPWKLTCTSSLGGSLVDVPEADAFRLVVTTAFVPAGALVDFVSAPAVAAALVPDGGALVGFVA